MKKPNKPTTSKLLPASKSKFKSKHKDRHLRGDGDDDDEDSLLFTYKKNQKVYCRHKSVFYPATIQATKFDDRQDGLPVYRVHYSGWNKKWDEWVDEQSIRPFTAANSALAEESFKSAKALEEKAKKQVKMSEKDEGESRKLQKLPDYIIQDLQEAVQISGVPYEFSPYVTPSKEGDDGDILTKLNSDSVIFESPLSRAPTKQKQKQKQNLPKKASSVVSKLTPTPTATPARSSSKYLSNFFWVRKTHFLI